MQQQTPDPVVQTAEIEEGGFEHVPADDMTGSRGTWFSHASDTASDISSSSGFVATSRSSREKPRLHESNLPSEVTRTSAAAINIWSSITSALGCESETWDHAPVVEIPLMAENTRSTGQVQPENANDTLNLQEQIMLSNDLEFSHHFLSHPCEEVSEVSDKGATELVNVTMPSTLFASRRRGWDYSDWDNSSRPSRTPVSQRSSLSAASSKNRTYYWAFTSNAKKSLTKSKRKSPVTKGKSSDQSRPQLCNTGTHQTFLFGRWFFAGLILSLVVSLIVIQASSGNKQCNLDAATANHNHSLMMQFQKVASYILNLKSEPETTCPPKNKTQNNVNMNVAEPTFDPILALLDKSSDPMIDMMNDLKRLPEGVKLSLSAHTALSLASIIEAMRPSAVVPGVTPFDVIRVGDSLRDLAISLNSAADALVVVQTEGHFTARNIVRLFRGLLRGVEGVYDAILEDSQNTVHDALAPQLGIFELMVKWAGLSYPLSNISNESSKGLKGAGRMAHQVLKEKLDDVLDEMDLMLNNLEIQVFQMIERGQVVHANWVFANNLAERERRKVVLAVQDVKGDLERQNQSNHEWVRKWTEWIRHEERNLEDKATERSLRRLEADMSTLCRVISSLKQIAPGVVQIGDRVKQMRIGVQRFRAELKASGVTFGGNVQHQIAQMKELITKLTSAVSTTSH
ncbi:hypothetical protein BC830DRAFT_1109431 [Chytriomyces sp. MP71]|nr:hypothetical protein BC830DRAFT_1109431 [Chytriomyces sp. MP71]